jgi:hypothetical protein
LHLFDRIEVAGAGVERDARQQQRQLQIVQACGLLHHVLAREIVAAHLEHFDQGLRIGITDRGLGVGDAAGKAMAVHERKPLLKLRRVPPLRIGWIFNRAGRNRSDAFLQTCRLHHRTDRIADRVKEVRGLPADIKDFADGLGGKFRSCRRKQHVGATPL